jgi:hypothetical protein
MLLLPSCSCWTGSAQKRNFFGRKGKKAERFNREETKREIYLSNQRKKERNKGSAGGVLGRGRGVHEKT